MTRAALSILMARHFKTAHTYKHNKQHEQFFRYIISNYESEAAIAVDTSAVASNQVRHDDFSQGLGCEDM